MEHRHLLTLFRGCDQSINKIHSFLKSTREKRMRLPFIYYTNIKCDYGSHAFYAFTMHFTRYDQTL